MNALSARQKAERIVQLFRSRQPTRTLPSELAPADLDEAYEIRSAFQEIEEKAGRGAVAGYKIGLTTPVMQRLCGIDEPCYGAIFASEVHHGRAVLSAANYCRIGVETEIAFRLGEDLPGGGDQNGAAAAVESCMAAIELIEDLQYDYTRLNAAAMVAGNVWNAGVVLGAPVSDWKRLDLAQVRATLSINGERSAVAPAAT
jgi:2-keto-4-pentenoate hydratase